MIFEGVRELFKKRKDIAARARTAENSSFKEPQDLATLIDALVQTAEVTKKEQPIQNGKEFFIQPSSVTAESLRRLAELPYEVSLIRYQNQETVSLFIGEEFETKDQVATAFDKRPTMMIHTHPKQGSKFVSFQDISAAELFGSMSEKLTSLLVTDKGVIEYRSIPRTDTRDKYLEWEREHSLDQLDMSEYITKLEGLIRESGAIVQELDWENDEDKQAITKLVSEAMGEV